MSCVVQACTIQYGEWRNTRPGKTNFSLMVVLGDQHVHQIVSLLPHIFGVYEGVAPFTCAHYFRRSMALMFKVKMPPSHKVFIFTFASLGTVQHTYVTKY